MKYKVLPRILGIVGAKAGVGCTHLSLAIANYLCSVENKKVFYIEIGKESQVLPFIEAYPEMYKDFLVYKYYRVRYLPVADKSEVIDFLSEAEGIIIVDLGSYSEDQRDILSLCEKLVVMGSLQLWCENAYQNLVQDFINNKIDKGQMDYYCVENNYAKRRWFWLNFHRKIGTLPYLENPFEIKEKEFRELQKIIYKK